MFRFQIGFEVGDRYLATMKDGSCQATVNIGFGENSTHTDSQKSPFANMPTKAIGRINHPSAIQRDFDADTYTFDYHYGGINRRFPNSILNLPQRLMNYTNRYLKQRIK